MPRAYSLDLRERVVAFVEAGHSRHAAAAHFDVSVSFVVKLMTAWRTRGSLAPKAAGGRRHAKLEPHRAFLLERVGEKDDITMPELAAELLAATGVQVAPASLPLRSRVGSSVPATGSKKTLLASEQDRPDITQARLEWTEKRQPRMRLEPHRLVFIDETGTTTKMTRPRGRCLKGQRLRSKAPFGHWKTQTFIAGLRCYGLTAPFVVDRPMNRRIFEAYVETQLAPTLSKGDVVILDNLAAHKSAKAEAAIKAQGAWMLFLPAYSPDLNPIELTFSYIKRYLQEHQEIIQAVNNLSDIIKSAFDSITIDQCTNWIASCGYQ